MNRFTRVPNVLLEGVLKADLTKTQLKIVMAVCRQTYGWDKDYESITVTKLSEMTNCSERQVKRDVKYLVEEDFLLEVGKGRGRKLGVNMKAFT